MKPLLLTGLAFALCCNAAHADSRATQLTADSVTVDANGSLLAPGVTIAVQTPGLTAAHARMLLDSSKQVAVMELRDVEVDIDGVSLASDSATYCPELKTMTGHRFTLKRRR